MRVRRFAAIGVLLGLGLVSAGAAGAQPGRGGDTQPLKERIERHFRVSGSRSGIVLVPRRDIAGITSLEVADGSVSLDGLVVTGNELRERLGSDAEDVLQLSYLDNATLRRLFAGSGAEPGTPASESRQPESWDRDRDRYERRSGARVRIGGSIDVPENERVSDAVVAIGGSVRVDGRVDDNVVAIGGSVVLGPKAIVGGDVTSIGGHVTRDAGAEVRGKINEIAFGRPSWHGPGRAWPAIDWQIGRWIALTGTLLRFGFILLVVALTAAVATVPATTIAQRAAAAPGLALLAGVALQVLFLPALIAMALALVISIVGIPLLTLLPLVVLAAVVLAIGGFTGVAIRVGTVVGPRLGMRGGGPVGAALVGVMTVMAVSVLARVIGLLLFPVGMMGHGVIAGVGFAIEYVAWTIGMGAALMAAFDWQRRPRIPPVPTATP